MIYEVEYQYDEGVVPEERSVTACQLHAEMDLWATRYKIIIVNEYFKERIEKERYRFCKMTKEKRGWVLH